MYEAFVSGTNIKLYLSKPGIYTFTNQSATGKTRLFKCLRAIQKRGEPVLTYTYSDKQLFGLNVSDILKSKPAQIVMLDRYDMYNGDGADSILKCAEHSIILVDCKGSLLVTDEDEICLIDMGYNTIDVESCI